MSLDILPHVHGLHRIGCYLGTVIILFLTTSSLLLVVVSVTKIKLLFSTVVVGDAKHLLSVYVYFIRVN